MSNFQNALEYSAKWLEIIMQDSVTVDETKTNFVNHFNAGWVEYRKSMTEAGDYAAIEWRGEGSKFYDNFGNEYLCYPGGGIVGLLVGRIK